MTLPTGQRAERAPEEVKKYYGEQEGMTLPLACSGIGSRQKLEIDLESDTRRWVAMCRRRHLFSQILSPCGFNL
jgi:hypothetical protein